MPKIGKYISSLKWSWFFFLLRLWCGRWTRSGHFWHKWRYVKRAKSRHLDLRLQSLEVLTQIFSIWRLHSGRAGPGGRRHRDRWGSRSPAAFFAGLCCEITRILTPSLLRNSFVTAAKPKFNPRGRVQVAQDHPLLHAGWLRWDCSKYCTLHYIFYSYTLYLFSVFSRANCMNKSIQYLLSQVFNHITSIKYYLKIGSEYLILI